MSEPHTSDSELDRCLVRAGIRADSFEARKRAVEMLEALGFEIRPIDRKSRQPIDLAESDIRDRYIAESGRYFCDPRKCVKWHEEERDQWALSLEGEPGVTGHFWQDGSAATNLPGHDLVRRVSSEATP